MSKVVKYDLGVFGLFAPEIVIVHLGSNDLTSMSAAKTGSAIEDLARLLLWRKTSLCMSDHFCRDSPSFNKQGELLTQYLKVVLEPLSYVIYWPHRGFWNCKIRFFARDGVHLNSLGQYKFFRSLRGEVLKCFKAITPP